MKTNLFLILLFCMCCLKGFADEKALWDVAATYHIAEQSDNGTLALDDGSIWSVGYFWGSIAKKWENGDKIHISVPIDLAFYFYQIDNLTKKETIWSRGEQQIPNPGYASCQWISDITAIDGITHLQTNQGLVFTQATTEKLPWQIGDVLTLIKCCWPKGSPAVINHSYNSLLIVHVNLIGGFTSALESPDTYGLRPGALPPD